MVLDYNPFWFVVLWIIGIFFISLAIYFAFQVAFADMTIEDYEECVKQGIPPKLCIVILSQPPLQGA